MKLFKHYKHGSKRGGQRYNVRRGMAIAKCPDCKGTGSEYVRWSGGPRPGYWTTCRKCRGSGLVN